MGVEIRTTHPQDSVSRPVDLPADAYGPAVPEPVERELGIDNPNQFVAFIWEYAGFSLDKMIGDFAKHGSDAEKKERRESLFNGSAALATRFEVLFKLFKEMRIEIEKNEILGDDFKIKLEIALQEITDASGFPYQGQAGPYDREKFLEKAGEISSFLHDFGNLLTTSSGYHQLYSMRPPTDEVADSWAGQSYKTIQQAKYFLTEMIGLEQETVPYPEEIVRVAQFFKEEAARFADNPKYGFKTIVTIDESVFQANTRTSPFTLFVAMRFLGNIMENTHKAYLDLKEGQLTRKELHIGMRVQGNMLYITFDDFGAGFPMDVQKKPKPEENPEVTQKPKFDITLGKFLGSHRGVFIRQFIFDGTSFWLSKENSGNGIGMVGLKAIIEEVLQGTFTAGNRMGFISERGGARIEVGIPLN